MSKRLGSGRPRKAGEPRKGTGQAAARRFFRAYNKWLDRPEDFIWRDWYDIEAYATYRIKNPNPITGLSKIKAKYEAVKLWWFMKKQVTKKGGTKKQVAAIDLAKKYANVIEKLQQGEQVEGFTLVRTVKVEGNNTVEGIVPLQNGFTLCAYK